MKERPILFSAPMVRAILDGTKTQTRRVVKGAASGDDGPAYWPGLRHGGDFVRAGHCPFGVPGDRLWVRETFCENYFGDSHEGTLKHGYRADFNRERLAGIVPEPRWTPSIHMPRWASRITLEITDVRVERLQAISEEDARAEGVEPDVCQCCEKSEPCEVGPTGARACVCCVGHPVVWGSSFASLWDSLNAKRAPWSSNPWVWAISFKRVTP